MEAVALALGMSRRSRNRWSPCPACGTEHTKSDRRPTVLLSGRGWYCVACRRGGPDELSLVAWALNHSRRVDAKVYDFVEHKRVRTIAPRPEAAPKRIDPALALRLARPFSEVEDERLSAWLAHRAISPRAPAGWLPRFSAPWWPSSETWPIVLPACTGTGKVESLHGVAVGEAPHKTTWPRGAESRELLFAAPSTRAWLRGVGSAPREVLVVEGATDFLSAVVELPDMAVLGITSGAASALALVPKVRGQRWYVATDPDTAGRKYAEKVAEYVFPFPVYPFPLR